MKHGSRSNRKHGRRDASYARAARAAREEQHALPLGAREERDAEKNAAYSADERHQDTPSYCQRRHVTPLQTAQEGIGGGEAPNGRDTAEAPLEGAGGVLTLPEQRLQPAPYVATPATTVKRG